MKNMKQRMRELNETVVEDKVIDKNTGEIVSELSPKAEVKRYK